MINKAVIVGNFDLPDGNAAGNRVLGIAKLLVELGYKVDVYGTKLSNKAEEYPGITLKKRSKPNRFISWFGYVFNLNYLPNPAKYKKVLIIFYNYPSLSTVLAMVKFRKFNNVRIINDITEWYHPNQKHIIPRLFKKIDVLIRMKFVNKKVNGLIVISELLENFYYNCLTVRIPPLFHDFELLDIKSNVKLNAPIKFVYFGSPGQKDQLEIVLRAFYRLSLEGFNNWVFNIMGIERLEEIIEDKNLITELSHDNKITLFGWVSREKVLDELGEADYSFLIRKSTRLNNAGFPIKFVESRTLGVAQILSNFSDIHSYINEYDVFIDDFTEEKLIEELRKILIKNVKHEKKKDITFTLENNEYKNELKFFLDELWEEQDEKNNDAHNNEKTGKRAQ